MFQVRFVSLRDRGGKVRIVALRPSALPVSGVHRSPYPSAQGGNLDDSDEVFFPLLKPRDPVTFSAHQWTVTLPSLLIECPFMKNATFFNIAQAPNILFPRVF